MELYPRAPAKPTAGIRTPADSRTEVLDTNLDLFVLKDTRYMVSLAIRHRRPINVTIKIISLKDIEKIDYLDR